MPYSTGFVQGPPPTAELVTGVSVPGAAAALAWASATFRMAPADLAERTELLVPPAVTLKGEDARLLGLFCGRAARELCPRLEELSLRGSALTPATLTKLAEGLGGRSEEDHDAEGLSLDLHGTLATALEARPSDAVACGDAIATLLQHAPHVEELDLGGNPLGVGGALVPIAQAVGKSEHLLHLYLAAVGLGKSADAPKRLAAALRKNGNLLSLDVRHNDLSDESVSLLLSLATSRPRSTSGERHALKLRVKPQALLPPGVHLERSPRDEETADENEHEDEPSAPAAPQRGSSGFFRNVGWRRSQS